MCPAHIRVVVVVAAAAAAVLCVPACVRAALQLQQSKKRRRGGQPGVASAHHDGAVLAKTSSNKTGDSGASVSPDCGVASLHALQEVRGTQCVSHVLRRVAGVCW